MTEEEFRRPPFFPDESPGLFRGAFALASVAALLVTPFQAGFALRPEVFCELTPAASEWLGSIANPRHLIAFAILTVLAVLAMRGRPLWQPLAVVLAVTICVELEQAIFNDGHCRLRNMLPNVIAIAAGTGVAVLVRRWLERRRG